LGRRFYYYLFKNNFAYLTGLVLLRFVEFFLRPFSLRAKRSFGRLIGGLWYLTDFPNRELTRRDMAYALGSSHSVSVRQRAQRLSMSNTMAYLFEAYFASDISREQMLSMVIDRSWESTLENTIAKGKGAVVLTAHFSNEALLCYFISAFKRSSCIAKYQRIFNDMMIEHRNAMNVETLNEFETSYDSLIDIIKRGEIILATIDRPLKRVKGVYVEFFGHRIIAPYYPVDIARISGAPLFVALLSSSKYRYNMHLQGPIYIPSEMDERKSREHYTQMIFSILEKHISMHPHEWQWQNKRFTKKYWGIPRYNGG